MPIVNDLTFDGSTPFRTAAAASSMPEVTLGDNLHQQICDGSVLPETYSCVVGAL